MKNNTLEIQRQLLLPEGMYKTIEQVRDIEEDDFAIYKLEHLGLVNLAGWNGDEYTECYVINELGERIQDLNIILKPRYFVIGYDQIFESDEPIYFYCK